MSKQKEKEPAPAKAETSSNVEKNISINNYNALKNSCQVAMSSSDKAVKGILAIYEQMSEKEQRAFDLGECYSNMLGALVELEEVVEEEKF